MIQASLTCDLCIAHACLQMRCVELDLIFSAGIVAANIFHWSICNGIWLEGGSWHCCPLCYLFLKPVSSVFMLAKVLALKDFKEFLSKGIFSLFTV